MGREAPIMEQGGEKDVRAHGMGPESDADSGPAGERGF